MFVYLFSKLEAICSRMILSSPAFAQYPWIRMTGVAPKEKLISCSSPRCMTRWPYTTCLADAAAIPQAATSKKKNRAPLPNFKRPRSQRVISTDRLGDPLPDGALARMGSGVRLRHVEGVHALLAFFLSRRELFSRFRSMNRRYYCLPL